MNEQHEGAPQMRTLDVEIFNTRFTVRATENVAYLQTLAAEVDARIQQLYEPHRRDLSIAGRDHGRVPCSRMRPSNSTGND